MPDEAKIPMLPTPWAVGHSDGFGTMVSADNSLTVAIVFHGKAHAELMVRAVNTHADLLAACEAVLPMFRHGMDPRTPAGQEAIRLMHEAIAKGKGGYSCPCPHCAPDAKATGAA